MVFFNGFLRFIVVLFSFADLLVVFFNSLQVLHLIHTVIYSPDRF